MAKPQAPLMTKSQTMFMAKPQAPLMTKSQAPLISNNCEKQAPLIKKLLMFFFSLGLFLLSLYTPPESLAQCVGGVNCFQCTWTGIQCVVDISTMTCRPGFERVDSVCTSITDSSSCFGQINNDCVETAPGSCYECVDGITGCIPRDPADPRCEYDDFPSCDAACKGIVPVRFTCDPYGNCLESGSGPYTSLGACVEVCSGAAAPDPRCGPGLTGINTAIGCIPVSNTNAFIAFLLRWGIGIAGGIAFILIIVAGFQITTSQGDPKKLQAGRELLTSAIAGLVLLIFSVLILRLIGVNLLGIPGFGS